jgi:class 3 adenylate cyclase
MDVRSVPCWLLVADIVNSTKLTIDLPPDKLSRVVGQWLAQCKETIEQCGGRINQFLGDGFLAFWYDGEGIEVNVDKAIRALADFQSQEPLAFRFVVHLGSVMVGGIAVGEEESLSGGEMHFVFRMEKLAGSLGELRLVSEEARKRLESLVRAKRVGRHRLQGFTGNFQFYAL